MLRGHHVLFCLTAAIALGRKINVTTASDLFELSRDKRALSNEQLTVYLLNDIDFGKNNTAFPPIEEFIGLFDGQGHVISNLRPNATMGGALFGYSGGVTIRNLVMDASCKVEAQESTSMWSGGVIGACGGHERYCSIENTLNMGDVSYTLSMETGQLALGGIIGMCIGEPCFCIITNCANYGKISMNNVFDADATWVFVGGIVGYIRGSIEFQKVISAVHNCINFGSVSVNENNSLLNMTFIGGISGIADKNTAFESSVSSGLVGTRGQLFLSAGSVAGFAHKWTQFSSCYWFSKSDLMPFGRGNVSENNCTSYYENFSLADTGKNTIITDALNEYTSPRFDRKSKWMLNRNGFTVTFVANKHILAELSSNIILMPDLIIESFSGWYTERECKNKVNFTQEVKGNITLYTRFRENFARVDIVKTTFFGTIAGIIISAILISMIVIFMIFLILGMFKGQKEKR